MVWDQLPFTDPADGGQPDVSQPGRRLPAGGLALDEFAMACVGAALRAGAVLRGELTGHTPEVTLSAAHVADLVRAERFSQVDGQGPGNGFAPLSRFWPTADGWLRTHANYPWHRDALLRATATTDDRVGEALSDGTAAEWESDIVSAGGMAAAVRTRAQWAAHPAGRALTGQPLVACDLVGAAPVRRTGRIRVLDLTRVLAGPAATRLLGALGADVLRVDSPQRPELAFHRVDGVIGKRSTVLDLAAPGDRARLAALLAHADVLVYGYRPRSSFALDPQELAARHPGLLTVQLSAWGTAGPWGDRRGFDSLVQAACGIADLLRGPDGRPGALPCQLLDHATGYLLAAAVLLCMREHARIGGSHHVQLNLARTAEALLAQPLQPLPSLPAPPEAGSRPDWTTTLRGPGGAAVTTVRAPGAYDGVPVRWPEPVTTYAGDAAVWS